MLTFHDLYSAYSLEVYRFAYWLAGNTEDAEDITSETFVRAWTNLARIRTETLKAYLLTIARNVYLNQLRKVNRRQRLLEVHPDPNPGPESRVEKRAELEMVSKVLQSLPESDRVAFIMRVGHDLPYLEIARALQISESAAKVKVHRVRKRMLAARLAEEIP